MFRVTNKRVMPRVGTECVLQRIMNLFGEGEGVFTGGTVTHSSIHITAVITMLFIVAMDKGIKAVNTCCSTRVV